jgi:hypothetical protein
MIFIGIYLLWIGCLLSYLSSNKQKLNKKHIKKLPAWSLFTVCLLLATYCFTYRYDLVVSMLNTVLLVMTMWLLLVIFSSHINRRLVLVGTLGMSLFTSVVLIGMK